MSSVQSAYAQVGPREKYLVATGAAVNVNVTAGEVVTSSMSSADFGTATETGTVITAGQLFRDMGKTVTVYDADSFLAVEKYQKVQLVSGGANGDSEGVGDFTVADRYIGVWNAAGTAVNVARVG